jgi:hypothetical protein
MKRIAQDVAIETLTYVLNPTQPVIIIDRKNMYDDGEMVFQGEVSELNSYEYSKILKSKIYSIINRDGIFVFAIETANDKY